MEINGKPVSYIVDNMYFTNVKEKYGDDYFINTEIILYENGGPAHMVTNILEDFVYEVDFIIEKDCIINEIGYMDFLDIDNIEVTVNEESVEFNNNLVLKKGDCVKFKYNLVYKDEVSENDIVKTTFFVDYTSDEKKYLFIDEQGMIVVDMFNDDFIKNYIDEEIEEKN